MTPEHYCVACGGVCRLAQARAEEIAALKADHIKYMFAAGEEATRLGQEIVRLKAEVAILSVPPSVRTAASIPVGSAI